jgi:hypothetical protein
MGIPFEAFVLSDQWLTAALQPGLVDTVVLGSPGVSHIFLSHYIA